MENERLSSYRRWYKELDARKAQLEADEIEDPRVHRLLDAELRCLEELISLDSELLLLLPSNSEQANPPETETSRGVTTWPGDSQIPPVEGLDLSLVTDMLILSATSPWVVFIAERFKWNTVYVSPSVKRLLGWRQRELVGVPVHERCHPDDVQTMVTMFNAGATSSGNSLYYRRMRRDRSYVTVQGTGRVLGQRWFAWMELLVADAEPIQSGSPIKRSNTTSPSINNSLRLTPAPPVDPPSLPLTPYIQNSLASSRNLSSHSINEHSMSRPLPGGSLDTGRHFHSAPLEERKSSADIMQRASTGGMPVGPLEFARRKSSNVSRPTSPLSEQESEASFGSGRYNNGHDSLMVSHSSGTLGLSTPALARNARNDSLNPMNSAERLRGGSQRTSLRGSGSNSSTANASLDINLLQSTHDSKLRSAGGSNDPHASPPSQPLSRSGSGSSGGKAPPTNTLKVMPEFGYGGNPSEKEMDPMRTSVDHESVLDASGLVGTPLYKETSNGDLLDEPDRWRPQNEDSGTDVGLALAPASGGQSPNLTAGNAALTAGRYRARPAPAANRGRAYAPPSPAASFSAIPPKPEGEKEGIRGAKVLLVEDDVTNRTVGQRLLESLHCEVTVTCNGKEALEAMRGNPEDPFSLSELSEDEELPPRFDLVLMDLLMPVMDGLRAVEKFRDWEQDQRPSRKRMLIFALTGNVSDGDMVKCAQSGFDEFVSKPLTVEKLLHRLKGVCKTTDRFPGLRLSNFALPA